MSKKYFKREEMGRFEEKMFNHKYDYDTDLYTRNGLSHVGILAIFACICVCVIIAATIVIIVT